MNQQLYNWITYGVPAFVLGAALMCMGMSICYQHWPKFRRWFYISTCLFCTDPALPGERTCYRHACIGRSEG